VGVEKTLIHTPLQGGSVGKKCVMHGITVSMTYFDVKLRRKVGTSASIRPQNYNRDHASGARQDDRVAMNAVLCKFLQFKANALSRKSKSSPGSANLLHTETTHSSACQ